MSLDYQLQTHLVIEQPGTSDDRVFREHDEDAWKAVQAHLVRKSCSYAGSGSIVRGEYYEKIMNMCGEERSSSRSSSGEHGAPRSRPLFFP